jgi:hypothetical protein
MKQKEERGETTTARFIMYRFDRDLALRAAGWRRRGRWPGDRVVPPSAVPTDWQAPRLTRVA